MDSQGGQPPRRRAGDADSRRFPGDPGLRDWQKNTWFGPTPVNADPFEEPESAPELLKERSDNIRNREGDFWKAQEPTAYQYQAGDVKKGGEKAQKKKAGVSKYLIIGSLVTIAVLLVLHLIVFRVREIRVTGNRLVSAQDVIRFSGIRYGSGMLDLNEEQTEQRFTASALSAAASEGNYNFYSLQFRYLERQFPGTVIIAVKEREPCCWLTWCGILYVMDKNRMVLFESEDSGIGVADLPEVQGLDIRSGSKAGQTMMLTSSLQESVFSELFLEMKIMDCTRLIQNVDLSNISSILLVTRDGYTVSLGDRNNIHAKLRSMLLVREELLRQGQQGGTINVLTPETPYYSPSSV